MSNSRGGFRLLLGAGLSLVRSALAATSCTISVKLGRVILVAVFAYEFFASGVSSLSLCGGLVTRVDLRGGTGVTLASWFDTV